MNLSTFVASVIDSAMPGATLVRVTRERDGALGRAAIYKLDNPSIDYDGKAFSFVWISTSMVFGLETYAFACDEDGDVPCMIELPGSEKGTSSHERVLRGMGYAYRGEKELDSIYGIL